MTRRPEASDTISGNGAEHARSERDAHVVIVNPASGSTISTDDLRDAFSQLGATVVWKETTEDDPGAGQATEAVDEGAGTVIACGGDGTVRACLAPLAGSDVALGIVALGTGNLLAANLGIASGLDGVETAVNGTLRTIDLGEANGESFAVMAGSGFDALMIRDANPDTKRRFGSVAYVVSAIRNLPTKLVPTTVEIDGAEVYDGRTAMVLVGNCGAVTGGLEVFPDARPDDGVLDVAVLAARGWMEWASVLWRLVRGLPQRSNLVERHRGRSVTVRTSSPRPYQLDGEDRPASNRLEINVRPSSLVVRVPAGSDENASDQTGSDVNGADRG